MTPRPKRGEIKRAAKLLARLATGYGKGWREFVPQCMDAFRGDNETSEDGTAARHTRYDAVR